MAEIEALVCRRAVQLVSELSLREVTFEGDALLVIKALTTSMADQSMYGHIVVDILHQTAPLRFFQFSHVNRSWNKVADALAKKAKAGLEFKVWIENIPGDIIPLPLDDLS